MSNLRKLIPGSGESFKGRTVETINELIDAVNAFRIHAGPGIRVNTTPSGVTITAERQPAIGGGGVKQCTYTAYVVRVTSAYQDGSYSGTIVAGDDAGKTVTFYLPASLMGQTLATGTIVLAAPVEVPETGEDDE